jgi:hypothetical protein
MSINTSQFRILILATVERDRIAIEQQLARQSPLASAELRHHAQLDSALRWTIQERWIPELVLLASGHSYSWSEQEFVDLWNALPLARWVVIHDGWSRSAFRHLSWLPSSCCIPRERFAIRLRQELSVLSGRRVAPPLTASLDETFLRDAELPSGISLKGLRVSLFTSDRDLRGWLRNMLEHFGATIVTLEQKPSAVLWDLDPWNEDRKTQLEIYRRRDPDCHILGLRNTVHELSTLDAEQHGVDHLLPKQLGTTAIIESLQEVHC